MAARPDSPDRPQEVSASATTMDKEARMSGRAVVGSCGGPVAIAAGWSHSVAVTEEGAAFVWGCGGNGRLGLGEHADVYRPLQVGYAGEFGRGVEGRGVEAGVAAAGGGLC